ncbi:MAG: phytanoyl-CoA dioxygenase family protein [Myxococcales bacterium]|nr:MAG: phytanoyl-CoA dioxygenase family protein [Myxococcales bacterium]
MTSRNDNQEWREAYETDGYVVLEGLLSAAELSQIREDLRRIFSKGPTGRNEFEGTRTQRIYTLVGRGLPFERLAEHPEIVSILDALLLPNYLITASQAIAIAPGETPQPVHTDDSFYLVPRPRQAISVSTMWAIDDFTEENGATEMIAGSHRWSDDELMNMYVGDDTVTLAPEYQPQLRPLVMRAGSCAVFAGTLVHRGGENRSPRVRTAISNQYCEPWARTQENFFLSIPRRKVAGMSSGLQSMLGYSIHPPFMGQVTARHPLKALDPNFDNPLED